MKEAGEEGEAAAAYITPGSVTPLLKLGKRVWVIVVVEVP
jgi:hypothetical protein